MHMFATEVIPRVRARASTPRGADTVLAGVK
jgi:hypothetical protein